MYDICTKVFESWTEIFEILTQIIEIYRKFWFMGGYQQSGDLKIPLGNAVPSFKIQNLAMETWGNPKKIRLLHVFFLTLNFQKKRTHIVQISSKITHL